MNICMLFIQFLEVLRPIEINILKGPGIMAMLPNIANFSTAMPQAVGCHVICLLPDSSCFLACFFVGRFVFFNRVFY